MARRVVSVLRAGPAALRSSDPVLEANAYAVAEEVDLTLVLRATGVELAIAAGEVRPAQLAGTPLPPSASGQELRGLIESGIDVHALDDDVSRLGLTGADLVEGVQLASADDIAGLLRAADAVLHW